jgi:hypothetical protein
MRGIAYDGKAADLWSCGVILFVFLSGGMLVDCWCNVLLVGVVTTSVVILVCRASI